MRYPDVAGVDLRAIPLFVAPGLVIANGVGEGAEADGDALPPATGLRPGDVDGHFLLNVSPPAYRR